jgi:HlyD family secretion protein
MAIGGFVGIGLILHTIHGQETRDIPPPPIAPPEKPYASTVAATGILEALSENVSIGVPVPGLVTEVSVKVNDIVKEGETLFRVDDRELQAQFIKFQAGVAVAEARVAVQKASLAKTKDLLDRMLSIKDRRAVSIDELNARQNDMNIGKAQLLASEAELKSAMADVKQTEMLIDRLVIKAPRDGTILQVNIRAGEYAAISPKSPAMVLGDLDQLQVRADVDEQNATRIRTGQNAKAYIKGDTKNPITLQFIRVEPYVIPKVSLTGASTERVDTRVLQVIYSLQRPKDPPIYVGQQVDVYIDAATSQPRP